MTWRTHALFGVDAICLLSLVPGGLAPGTALLAALSAFGALLPDLDASESKVRHVVKVGNFEPMALLGDLMHSAFGHRGLLHSALGLAIAGGFIVFACTLLKAGWQPGAALWLGYASHLIADACTPAGVPLLFPWRSGRVHFLPKRLRITTGSQAEDALLPLLLFPILLLLLPPLLAAA